MSRLPAKVSVIVPVYNTENELSDCLHSCLHQTLLDIEIICINDGSTDSSSAILSEFSKQDPRIRIIEKSNGGLSSARNAGLRAANGEWIMFLDSDDLLNPKACECVWLESLKHTTDIVTFGTHLLPELGEPGFWLKGVLSIKEERFYRFAPNILFKKPGAKPFVWRQAYRRDFLVKHNLEFAEQVRFGEDMVFQMHAFPHAQNFSFISDSLYIYRWQRSGSLMDQAQQDMDKKIQKHLLMLEVISEYWQKQKWFELYGTEYVEWMLSFIVPDTQAKIVMQAESHLLHLAQIIKKYDLNKYMKGMRYHARMQARLLPK